MKLSERIHGWLISRMIDGYYKVSDSEIKVALDEATQLEAENAALKRENKLWQEAGRESALMLRGFLGFGPSTRLELLIAQLEENHG